MNENNVFENQPIPENNPNVAEPAQPVQPVQPEQPVYAAPVDVDPPAQPVQPTYTQPAYVPAAPVKEEGEGLAIGSLVCSILSFFCCGILSIVGIILGAVAKKKGYKGGMATAGIVVGAIYTGILVITAIVMAILHICFGVGIFALASEVAYDSYEDSYGYYDSYDYDYDNYDDYFDYDFDY